MKISNKSVNDLKIIAYYTGLVVLGTAIVMLIPMLVSLCYGEWNTFLIFW